jgi:hypothetical protein
MSNVIRVPHLIHRQAVEAYEATCQRAAAKLKRITKGEITGYCMAACTSLSALDVVDVLRAYAEDLPCV